MKHPRVKRKIRSTLAQRKDLASYFEIGELTVRQSLTYTHHSRLARLVCREAIARGCEPVVTLPVDNYWDDDEGMITREYHNETTVSIDKESGEINTSVGLEVISTVYPPADLDIDALQLWFAAIEAACAAAKGFPKRYE